MTQLCEGQRATVLQLPVTQPLAEHAPKATAARAASLTLLWCFPVTFQPPQTVVRVPLQQAMVLVWGLGVVRLGRRLLGGDLGWSWPVSAMFGALVTGLITGSLAWPWLLPVAMTLGLGSWLVMAYKLSMTTVVGLSVGGAAYAVLVWRLGVVLLAQPAVQRLAHVCHLRGDCTQLEHLAHWTAFTMTALSLSIPLVRYGVFMPQMAFVLTLGTGMVFWGLAAQRYQRRLHRYLVLDSGMLAGVLIYSWGFHATPGPPLARWQALLSTPGLGLTCVLLSVGLWGMACLVRRFLETAAPSTCPPDNARRGITPVRQATAGRGQPDGAAGHRTGPGADSSYRPGMGVQRWLFQPWGTGSGWYQPAAR